jgi:hypothetical protein
MQHDKRNVQNAPEKNIQVQLARFMGHGTQQPLAGSLHCASIMCHFMN